MVEADERLRMSRQKLADSGITGDLEEGLFVASAVQTSGLGGACEEEIGLPDLVDYLYQSFQDDWMDQLDRLIAMHQEPMF
jgi:hypothetical protein